MSDEDRLRPPWRPPPWWADAVGVWLASRVGLLVMSLVAAWTVQSHDVAAVPSLQDLWNHWDVGLFQRAAAHGWFGHGSDPNQAVDFPGFPLLLRAVHLVVPDWIVAGLLISALAGVATSVALYRLAADEDPASGVDGRSRSGQRAVCYLVLFPYAVFLFAGYSEGLFLAFATTGWWAARRERWLAASLLAAGAAATRVTGLAFALAVVAQYLVANHHRRRWRLLDRRAPLLALPALPVLGYLLYLHAYTGRWDAYTVAQQRGWGRSLATPWDGWRTTFAAATAPHQPAAYAWFWRAELAAAVVGLVLTVVLVRQRRWGEATFVGANLLMMTCTSYYASGVRAVLVWFPLYLLLARLTRHRAWLHGALVWLMGPAMVAVSVAFVGGSWID